MAVRYCASMILRASPPGKAADIILRDGLAAVSGEHTHCHSHVVTPPGWLGLST